MSIADMMQQELDVWKRLGAPVGQNLKRPVLEHGRAYELDREASAAQHKGELKNCFANAARGAIEAWYSGEDLTYVEGFAYRGMSALVVHHAWLLNAEGKALEVTWRDGGNECGFCADGQIVPEYDEDDEDEETWEPIPCPSCNGTGRLPDGQQHRSLEDAEYYGIEVDTQTLIRILHRQGMFGVLNTPADIEEILAAQRAR